MSLTLADVVDRYESVSVWREEASVGEDEAPELLLLRAAGEELAAAAFLTCVSVLARRERESIRGGPGAGEGGERGERRWSVRCPSPRLAPPSEAGCGCRVCYSRGSHGCNDGGDGG